MLRIAPDSSSFNRKNPIKGIESDAFLPQHLDEANDCFNRKNPIKGIERHLGCREV